MTKELEEEHNNNQQAMEIKSKEKKDLRTKKGETESQGEEDDGNQDSVLVDYDNEEVEEIANALEQFTADKTPHLYGEVMSVEMEGFDDYFLCSVFDYLVGHESKAKAFLAI
ncbi:hypothetical protein Godav_002588, partial [Gossypium davidsonii]|nr:hypothetical protein [Gossypium davidsonii]